MKENPPAVPEFDKVRYYLILIFVIIFHLSRKCSIFFGLQVTRNILGTQPRVTRFKINWDDSENGQADTTNDITPLTFNDSSCSQTAMEVS